MPNLKARDVVLPQQGQQSVVGVLANAKFAFVRAGRGWRIVEDAEEHGRVASVTLEEVVLRKAETNGNPAQQQLADRSDLIDVGDQRVAESRQRGEKIRAVQRQSRPNPRIVGSQLGAEVDSLLAIRPARGQLTIDWKVAAPRASAMRHRDRHLLFERRFEKLPRQRHRPIGEGRVDSMTGDIEKPELATCPIERLTNAS